MTIKDKLHDDYWVQRNKIRKRHEAELDTFNKEFAMRSNEVKVDDIVIDNIGAIRVTELTWSENYSTGIPEMVYKGRQLTKSLTPTKRGKETRAVYECNIEQIIKKEQS